MLMAFAQMNAKDLKDLVVKAHEVIKEEGRAKVDGNIRCVPGVKKIRTKGDLVFITFDADKTDSKKIIARFGKIGYKVAVVSEKPSEGKKPAVDGQSGASQQQNKKK